jgi:hypothetical protein
MKRREFITLIGGAAAPRVCIVHKEQKRALVLGKVADADVLLVAGIFGKSNGAFIQRFQETRGPSAVLD